MARGGFLSVTERKALEGITLGEEGLQSREAHCHWLQAALEAEPDSQLQLNLLWIKLLCS